MDDESIYNSVYLYINNEFSNDGFDKLREIRAYVQSFNCHEIVSNDLSYILSWEELNSITLTVEQKMHILYMYASRVDIGVV
jgi:hypothetical protein